MWPFTKPTWKNLIHKLALSAVDELTDQGELELAARNSRAFEVRIAAVEKITNQKALADIAINGDNGYVAWKALSKLSDMEALINIARFTIHDSVGEKAVSRLEEQKAFADVVRKATNACSRYWALSKLTDQELLYDCATDTSVSGYARISAADKLDDRKNAMEIYNYFFNDEESPYRPMACTRIHDGHYFKEGFCTRCGTEDDEPDNPSGYNGWGW